jgi:hypothetical protein
MLSAGSIAFESDYFSCGVSTPARPYSARKPDETPGGETRWKLLMWGIRATLLIQNGILTAAKAEKG